MDNPGEIMRLCRLCLVKDQVNIPIFDEQGDIRQIFLKISSCLPVKVSKEDQLPKSICDGCSNKLDLLYEFRNSSVNAEKALLSWVSQAIKDVDETVGVATQPVAKPSETQVKEETLEECHAPLVHSNDSMDAQESAAFDENSAKEESDEPPPPKRARRTAAVKAQINIAPDSDDEDDDDLDIDAEPLTKIEDESDESDGDEKDDPSYPDVPGTSADDQPGPSGVGKDGVEAPNHRTFETIYIQELNYKSDLWNTNICNEESRINHVDIKGEKKTLICEICLKEFKTEYYLSLHMHEHIAPGKPQYGCANCHQQFYLQETLHAHSFRCKPVIAKCGICGKNVNQFNIASHMRMHSEKRYKCDVCNKEFKYNWYLKKHMSVKHDTESKHSCDVCDQQGLHYHCDLCEQVYVEKWKINVHKKRIHLKRTPIE